MLTRISLLFIFCGNLYAQSGSGTGIISKRVFTYHRGQTIRSVDVYDTVLTVSNPPSGWPAPVYVNTEYNARDNDNSSVAYNGIMSHLIYGRDSSATGYAHAYSSVFDVRGAGDTTGEHASLFAVQRYYNAVRDRVWFTDFSVQGSTGKPNLLTGINMFMKNHYNGSPTNTPSSPLLLYTKPGSGGGNGSPFDTAMSYPLDVGLSIMGYSGRVKTSGVGRQSFGFTEGIRVGGRGGGWNIDTSLFQTGMHVQDWQDYAIKIDSMAHSPSGGNHSSGIYFGNSSWRPEYWIDLKDATLPTSASLRLKGSMVNVDSNSTETSRWNTQSGYIGIGDTNPSAPIVIRQKSTSSLVAKTDSSNINVAINLQAYTGKGSFVNFDSMGTTRWQMGLQSSGNFGIFDPVNSLTSMKIFNTGGGEIDFYVPFISQSNARFKTYFDVDSATSAISGASGRGRIYSKASAGLFYDRGNGTSVRIDSLLGGSSGGDSLWQLTGSDIKQRNTTYNVVIHGSSSDSTLTVSGSAHATGNARIDGKLGIGGAPDSTLKVVGSTNVTTNLLVGSTTTLTGNATVGGTLGVTGAATFSATLRLNGATLDSTLSVAGGAHFSRGIRADSGFTGRNGVLLQDLPVFGQVVLPASVDTVNVTVSGMTSSNSMGVVSSNDATEMGSLKIVFRAGFFTVKNLFDAVNDQVVTYMYVKR